MDLSLVHPQGANLNICPGRREGGLESQEEAELLENVAFMGRGSWVWPFGSAKVCLDPFTGSPENSSRMHLNLLRSCCPGWVTGVWDSCKALGGTEAMSRSQKRGGRIYQASTSQPPGVF